MRSCAFGSEKNVFFVFFSDTRYTSAADEKIKINKNNRNDPVRYCYIMHGCTDDCERVQLQRLQQQQKQQQQQRHHQQTTTETTGTGAAAETAAVVLVVVVVGAQRGGGR